MKTKKYRGTRYATNKVDPKNPDSYVVCPMCKAKMLRISHTHTKIHGMTAKEFDLRYHLTKETKIAKNVINSLRFTRDVAIRRYGETEGIKKWDEYRKKQSITNTFEYKRDKYGWSERDFKEYNKNRACTLNNFIKRYGRVIGKEKWDRYVEVQKYVGVKYEYFIEKYGKEKGEELYNNILIAKMKGGGKFSNVAKEFCELIDDNNFNTFYHGKNAEYRIVCNNRAVAVDFYCADTNKVVEFYGDYWHANPKRYSEGYLLRSGYTAKEKWKADEDRLKLINNVGIEVLVIWESDYYDNNRECILKAKKFLYE